ncbi:hypothetical protein GCM10022380_59800 [Amycolatopsis tucumanensis]|uniref:Uncharacterized protein n=1 Tax=Amycolatopsis tucumanensis TaxID=401106 RepID=A0ABP7J423_9PSEU
MAACRAGVLVAARVVGGAVLTISCRTTPGPIAARHAGVPLAAGRERGLAHGATGMTLSVVIAACRAGALAAARLGTLSVELP